MFKKKSNNLLGLYWQEKSQEAFDWLTMAKRRRQQQRIKFLNSLVWVLVIATLLVIVNFLTLLPNGRDFLANALAAKSQLELMQSGLTNGDANVIGDSAAAAVINLDKSLEALRQIKYNPVTWLPYVREVVLDTENLLIAGRLSAGAVNRAWTQSQPLFRLLPGGTSLNFSQMSADDKRRLLEGVADSQKFLPTIEADLIEAQARLNKIHNHDLFWRYGLDVTAVADRLSVAVDKAKQAQELAFILPALAGYPSPARYLFILQNKDELRPTGGFIGTYGLGVVDAGEIKRLDTHDIYHLDMPVKDSFKVEPPLPIKKYLGQANWYFRDGNWSPDWPTTAKKLVWFYQEENRRQAQPDTLTEFDFVIGLTSDVVIDLLRLTGPITIRGQVYTPDNFVELLQLNTEKDFADFGFSRWDRKQVIGELTVEIQKKLLADLSKNWSTIIGILGQNLNSKNILVWSYPEGSREYFAKKDWQGEVKMTDGDYLMVVDANLAALKTDAVMNRGLDYELEERADGLYAKLNINYAHRGGKDWKTREYRTFTRVYVPQGSKLIKVAGFFGAESDLIKGEELGKTWFGAFTQIEPGKLGGLYFEYKLPYNLYDRTMSSGYDLLVQKQSGSAVDDWRVTLNFKTPIRHFQPASLKAAHQGSRVTWVGQLNGDSVYGASFK